MLDIIKGEGSDDDDDEIGNSWVIKTKKQIEGTRAKPTMREMERKRDLTLLRFATRQKNMKRKNKIKNSVLMQLSEHCEFKIAALRQGDLAKKEFERKKGRKKQLI